MGLTKNSVGKKAVDPGLAVLKQSPKDHVVAIAGNPNVGKSTLFNNLTNQNQHTGNWPGKTVASAQGYCSSEKYSYVLVDIPGTYSLMAHSAEEEVARNFLCFGGPEAVIVVCDATCLERNLNLVLQAMEICDKVLVCVNLLDEAKRKKIKIDLPLLSRRLEVPVVGTVAQKKGSLSLLLKALDQLIDSPPQKRLKIPYSPPLEQAISRLEPAVAEKQTGLDSRWLSLRLLDSDPGLFQEISRYTKEDLREDPKIAGALKDGLALLEKEGVSQETKKDEIVSCIVKKAESLCREAVTFQKAEYAFSDRKLDKILTSKRTGYPVMLLLLAVVFWLTIEGANFPSQLLSDGLFWIQDRLTDLFVYLNAPEWLHGALVLGAYRVLAWVVSVMLPPMAIFFPLFTLLEDSGYLPRIAYNLDKPFQKCRACGKQALTMCVDHTILQRAKAPYQSKKASGSRTLFLIFYPVAGMDPTVKGMLALLDLRKIIRSLYQFFSRIPAGHNQFPGTHFLNQGEKVLGRNKAVIVCGNDLVQHHQIKIPRPLPDSGKKFLINLCAFPLLLLA